MGKLGHGRFFAGRAPARAGTPGHDARLPGGISARSRPARKARRRTAASAVTGLALSGVLLSGLTAGPAAAGPPPPASGGVGCGGQSCWAFVQSFVTFTGNGVGPVNPAIAVPPPPCWMQPWMTAVQMKNFFDTVVSAGGTSGGAAWAPFAQQIEEEAKANPDGIWWGSNFDGSLSGSQCVGNLPLIQFVAPGAPPPLQFIPPRTLALMALSRMNVKPPVLHTNPAGTSYVDLPTFVRATVQGQDTIPVLSVTASIPTDSETVVATARGLFLSTDGPGTLFQPCGPPGSGFSASQMAAAGPGAAADCGVRYSQPSVGGPYSLSGTLRWVATWNGAFLAALTATGQAPPVPVAEIQSINRGR